LRIFEIFLSKPRKTQIPKDPKVPNGPKCPKIGRFLGFLPIFIKACGVS